MTADSIYFLNKSSPSFVPLKYIQVVADPHLEYTQEQILNNQEIKWSSFDSKLTLDLKTDYWFKLSINNQSAQKQWLVSPGFWYQGQVIYRDKNQDWNSINIGTQLKLSERQYPSNRPAALLHVPAEKFDIIIKAKGFRFGRENNAQHIQIISKDHYLKKQQGIIDTQNIYLGFAIGIGGFHLILFLWFREKVYFWLVAGVTVSPIFFHAIFGLGLINLWPNMPVWNDYSPSILAALASAVYLQFSASYLNLSESIPKVDKIIKVLFALILLSSMGVFYKDLNVLKFQAVFTSLAALILLFSAIFLVKKGARYAWFFIIGNCLLLITMLLWPLTELKIVYSINLLQSIVELAQFSSGFLGIMLALGMVDRMQVMRQKMLTQALQSERERVHQEKHTKALIQAQNIELESSNKALKELDDLKDDFLAKTSHELNTPLSGIIGLSQILLDKKINLDETERRDYLELIISRGDHLKDLVKELLDFVKTRKEVIKLYREKINVRAHIEKISLTFKAQVEQKGLSLIYDDLIDIEIFADARRLRQVLSILLDNAIKYTNKGHIRVFITHDESSAFIHVEDTGVGIKSEDLAHIFEPFKQLKQDKQLRDGAGLGLSICKHLVEMHDGELLVKSDFGKGSTFTVRLPISKSNVSK